MRELRKDLESTSDTPKEELVDNIDEIKMEEVLLGLKGLKQEEVFSFLGKNNFTPAETEMASGGFGNYDQLATVDATDMEQLQLSFEDNFNGVQATTNGQYLKNTSKSESKRFTDGGSTQKAGVFRANADGFCDWIRKDRTDESKHEVVKLPSLDFRRTSSAWSKYAGTQVTYSLADGYLENLREEEIISTPMDEVQAEFQYAESNYVIQTSDGVESVEVADIPKPIKLLIKRVENEDEIVTADFETNSNNARAKSKRIPCAKRKFEETLPPPKRKRCAKKSAGKSLKKSDPVASKKKPDSEELDFPFDGTVHQDDDFVYPSLSDEDTRSFGQPDDETWTPKMKMKIAEVKAVRPTRDRKTKNAVAKCLEAAAQKRADTETDESGRRCVRSPNEVKTLVAEDSVGDLIIDDATDDSFDSNVVDVYCAPSTSNVYSTPYSTSESGASPETSSVKKLPKKGRPKGQTKSNRLIPPKTCKLIQTPGTVQLDQTAKRVKSNLAASPSNNDKKNTNSYVTKRGKPKKGMATARQRLGKILKMHKMFF